MKPIHLFTALIHSKMFLWIFSLIWTVSPRLQEEAEVREQMNKKLFGLGLI